MFISEECVYLLEVQGVCISDKGTGCVIFYAFHVLFKAQCVFPCLCGMLRMHSCMHYSIAHDMYHTRPNFSSVLNFFYASRVF